MEAIKLVEHIVEKFPGVRTLLDENDQVIYFYVGNRRLDTCLNTTMMKDLKSVNGLDAECELEAMLEQYLRYETTNFSVFH